MSQQSPVSAAPAAHFSLASCAEQMERRSGFMTADLGATRRHISDLTGGRCAFSMPDSNKFISFRGAQTRLGSADFQYLHWEADADCETSTERPPASHIVLYIPLLGEFEARQRHQRVQVCAGQMLAVSSPGTTVRRWSGSCRLLNIVVSHDAIARLLAAEAGIHDDEIRFEPLTLVASGEAGTLRRHIENIVLDIADETSLLRSSHLAPQAERMLLWLLLAALSPELAETLRNGQSQIVPYYVKRAEAHMRQNMSEEIAISDLAAVAGVSVRSLYYGFKAYRNSTPMKYLKMLRIRAARGDLLKASSSGERVGAIAARYGYRNLSQFSREYRSVFKESPTATITGSTGTSFAGEA